MSFNTTTKLVHKMRMASVLERQNTVRPVAIRVLTHFARKLKPSTTLVSEFRSSGPFFDIRRVGRPTLRVTEMNVFELDDYGGVRCPLAKADRRLIEFFWELREFLYWMTQELEYEEYPRDIFCEGTKGAEHG